MSRKVRQDLFDTIGLMTHAVDVFVSFSREQALQALTDIHECAVAMGTYVEQLKGMDTQTVPVLEAICEAVYELSIAFDEHPDLNAEILDLKQLSGLLAQLKDTVGSEFPDKKEVVFLPYQLSMWDSLESVWRKAQADPDVDAYVIPIPYYEKDPDGNFKEFHYDGNEYPEDVPVVDYTTYDLKLHHPDEIYIHNPYDDWNLVTSIPEEFFSKRIKEYTDKLIYIPYFVLMDFDPENEEQAKHAVHFCFLPGTIYANEVWIQSEKLRDFYRTQYAMAAMLRGWEIDPEEIQRRFIYKESPKFEKLREEREKEQDIPEEWKSVIYREDGSKRKVILYNTSVTPLLNEEEKMLEKIERALEIFYENREDIALLWRPHPLYLQTINSMVPELRDRYMKLITKYQSEGWGIFDQSKDLDRALALADAYYGDASSLVALCQSIEIPVMIQNVHV